MKTLTALLAAAVVLGGVSIATAQNQPTTTPNPPPNSINKGNVPEKPSGSESQRAAKSPAHHARRHKHVAKRKTNKSSKSMMKKPQAGENSTKSQ